MHQGKVFKNKLKAWKLKYKKSNDDFAYEINTNTVVLYRNFKTETLSTRLLLKLCDSFGCPITDFFDDKYKLEGSLSNSNQKVQNKQYDLKLKEKESELNENDNIYNSESKDLIISEFKLIVSEKNKIITKQEFLLDYIEKQLKKQDN